MYTVTYDQIMVEFDCSREIATLGLSFFIWGLGVLEPYCQNFGIGDTNMTAKLSGHCS